MSKLRHKTQKLKSITNIFVDTKIEKAEIFISYVTLQREKGVS